MPSELGSHDVAPRHQNVPGPAGKPGPVPLKAERTMGKYSAWGGHKRREGGRRM